MDVVRELVAAGADVSAKDNDGHSALVAAAQASQPVVAELLLRAGAGADGGDQEAAQKVRACVCEPDEATCCKGSPMCVA